ncbi:trehalose-6-phosphate synthase [Penaeus vannamei]|uniref:Trehalose-6-phosphate synthase n=1 Tax=Penaeus vannamei TaxID=6689 RepID=A0A3R7PL38_PENVA|nr:trehalose-6-phosphate synthase [Penaeus vannamei]
MVVVANRLPFTVQKNPETGQMERKHCAGGLVTAVAPVVVETKGLWVGWSGQHQEDGVVEIPEANPNDQSPTAGLKSWQVKPMMSQKTLFDNYYNASGTGATGWACKLRWRSSCTSLSPRGTSCGSLDELLQGILGCDSVGFHVEDYCLNFIDCCQRRLGCRVDREQMLVEHNGRTVSVHPLPISIPFRFVSRRRRAGVKNDRAVAGLQCLRTDVKEYQELKEDLDQLIGRINGRFSTPNWSPIRYIYGCVSQEQLAAFYRDSSVAVVTPLRDGMNLVAKEFVACQSFLKSVDCLADNNLTPGRLLPLREEDFSHFLASYVTESSRLALILDYDGTLAPIAPHPDLAQMPEETRRVLERLAHMPDVNVAILSGRSMQNVKAMIGIEGITYAGCHGFEILHPDGTLFMHPIPHEYEVQLEQLKKQLEEEVCKDGAWLEQKVSGITFHYREVPEDKQQAIMSRAHELFRANGVKVYQSPMAYETRPPVTWDNGRAAIYLLRTLFGLDWCDRVSTIFAGDDISDEDAMRALQGMAVTFRVTTSPNLRTAATYRLPNTDAVLTMLKWVEKRLSSRLPIPNGRRSRTTSFSNSNNHSPPHAPSSPGRSRANSSSPPPEPNKQVMVMSDKVYHQLISRKSSPPRSSVSPVSSPSRSTV